MPNFILAAAPAADARSQALFAGQNRALQLLISGGSLEQVYEALVQTLEADLDGQAVGGILVLDPDGKRLRHGAAPSLPNSYKRAIDGIEIGPDIGTCCAAASRNVVVVTVDIDNDPGWAKFKALPLALGLRAAWSMPIRSSEGGVLGTFGIYFRECRRPTRRWRTTSKNGPREREWRVSFGGACPTRKGFRRRWKRPSTGWCRKRSPPLCRGVLVP